MATSQRYVSTNADIKVARSRFPLNRRTKFSYFHGYLQPVGSPIEVLPGDTIKAKISAFTRMSTPIVPFASDIRQEIDAFFVPKRILWNKTKLFYGEAETFGIAEKVYEPTCTADDSTFHLIEKASLDTNLKKSESFEAAFGLVYQATTSGLTKINVLPIRAFLSIFNEYYRDENYQDQYSWDKDETGIIDDLAFLGETSICLTNGSYLPKVNKDRDVVSSVLPWAQKGDPVSIGLTGDAEVSGNISIGSDRDLQFVTGNGESLYDGAAVFESVIIPGGVEFSNLKDPGGLSAYYKSGLKATHDLAVDLSSAASITINQLLYSLAYQDFLARAAHFGTRYKEYIYSMFGTTIADASEDIPEYLGRLRFNINVNDVVQTTGFESSGSTKLGSLGAISKSGSSGNLFTKSFTEPGYLVFVSYTKHERTYSSGIDRVFLKDELLDYYQPPFANIPDVPYSSENVWLDDTDVSLGFQEPFYDNRALQDRAYGMMNPMIDTLGEIWTLVEKWTDKPTIAGAFMMEDRDCIARVLATGVNGPDYLCDVLIEMDATRVMPLYSSGRLEKF